jgi:hypothetical protein
MSVNISTIRRDEAVTDDRVDPGVSRVAMGGMFGVLLLTVISIAWPAFARFYTTRTARDQSNLNCPYRGRGEFLLNASRLDILIPIRGIHILILLRRTPT